MTDIDEDNIDIGDTGTVSVGVPIEDLPKTRPGGNRSGVKLGRYRKLRSMTVKALRRIASGKESTFRDPKTGEKYTAGPPNHEILEAVRLLNEMGELRSDASMPASSEQDHTAENVFKAMVDAAEQQARIAEPTKIHLIEPDDNDYGPVSATADEIKLDVKADPDPDPDRIEFGFGFFALRVIQSGSLKTVWRCHDDRGEECATRASPERAWAWFLESTTVGQQCARDGKIAPPPATPTQPEQPRSNEAIDAYNGPASTHPPRGGLFVVSSRGVRRQVRTTRK
jgi:hypothetical protein